ncbi:MAG: bifunctional 4-hydroxy-2-oxoglutarate aldolase/2-dehydro-3-deoxy-phosphogluconate aldolase [Clostridia bacterium]
MLSKIISEKKLIVIVREVYGEQLLKLADALYDGGIRLIEVAFNQVDNDCLNKTTEAIFELCKRMSGKMHVGAGTVLTTLQVELAKKAGAEFIISPNADANVIRRTKELEMLSIAGAMTPSEMVFAHNSGADFVKVFPADKLGADYIKAISIPLGHIKLIATAGIREDNVLEFLQSGCAAVGVSARLADKVEIEKGNFSEFTSRAKQFCKLIETL